LPYILISAHFYVPLGLAMFSMWAFIAQRAAYPSGGIVAMGALAFTFFALVPIFFVETVVLHARIPRFRDPFVRSRILGVVFILAGILVQLIAALQDVFVSEA
jgi:hypothetical protein